ncbi:MAG: hypothetical protein ACLP9K_05435 [Nitrososphaerales archaeon]
MKRSTVATVTVATLILVLGTYVYEQTQMSRTTLPTTTTRATTGSGLLPPYDNGSSRYIPVGAFLYEWYGYNVTSGKWTGGLGTSHWNTTIDGVLQPLTIVKDEPSIGYYASDDNATLAWQLSNMQKAGISVIIVSWWGVGNDSGGGNNAKLDAAINNATLNFFRYVESTKSHWNFHIAIMVEPFNSTDLSASDYSNLYNYIENNFYHPFSGITFYWQGKPLLLSFNAPWGGRLPALPARSMFSYRLEGGVPNPVDWYFWEGGGFNDSSGGTAQIQNYESAPRISPDGEVGAIWRYDDYYLWNGTVGPGGRPGYMRFDLDGSQGMCNYEWNYIIQHRSEINLVLLYSWNEYHERSALEPHEDFTIGSVNMVGETSDHIKTLESTPDTVAGQPDPVNYLPYYFAAITVVFVVVLALVRYSRRF